MYFTSNPNPKEKLRQILLAVKYIIRTIDNQELYYKGKRIIDELEEWCHGLGKGISYQRQERGVYVQQILHTIQDPNEFMENDTVCYTIQIVLAITLKYNFAGEGKTVRSF